VTEDPEIVTFSIARSIIPEAVLVGLMSMILLVALWNAFWKLKFVIEIDVVR